MFRKENKLEEFYSDLVVILLVGLVIITLSLVVFDAVSDKMVTGFWIGVSISLFIFYYLRGKFNPLLGLLHLLLICASTGAEIWLAGLILSQFRTFEIGFWAVFVIGLVLSLFCINKQILDYVFFKLGAKQRNKQPVRII